ALDSYDAIVKGNKSPVIRPGRSAESRVIKLITSTDPEKRMPLSAPPLPAEAIEILRRWIDSGASEGQKVDAEETVTVSTTPVRTRKLDVLLATSTVPPRGALGSAAPAKLDLALKVGPLAPVTAVAF